MSRDLSHWLIEDDNQGDYPLSEDEIEDFDRNEFGSKEFETYNDDTLYETFIP